MDIHFVSTLTPEDEERLASIVLETAKGMLSCFPISYTLRVRASSEKVLEHTQTTSIAAPTSRLPRNRPAKVQTVSIRPGPEGLGSPHDEKKTPYTDD